MDFWNCSCDAFHVFISSRLEFAVLLCFYFADLLVWFPCSCLHVLDVFASGFWVIYGFLDFFCCENSSMEISCNHFLAKSTTWNLRGPAGRTATFWELSSSGAIDVWNSGRVSVVARRLPVLENGMYIERTVSPALFNNESEDCRILGA